MTKSFNCGSCSAPLEFEGTPSQKCRYCGSTVIAPPELFYASSATPFGDFSALTGKALKIAEIDQLIHEGKKIDAIKVFRETFGVGLKEAKDAVERMERGESVDISGMQVRSTRPMNAADVEKVKKIGYTIGGSILATILVSLLIIGGVMAAVIYIAWSAVDKIPTIANTTKTGPSPSPNAKATPMPNSTELLKLGGKGNGGGLFDDNRHVAVDGQGRIYSSDYSPHRIQVFDAEGKFLNQWAPAEGNNLYELLADRDGNVYIANDKGIFKHEGESGKLIARAANNYPRGMAMTWDGKIAVVSGKTISIFDNALKLVSEFKNAGEQANTTFGFETIATDGGGAMYLLDTHNNEICKFSADGKFLNRFSSHANAPHALAVDPKGRLFVSDTSTIFALDSNDGTVLKEIKANQAFGITFDRNGDLYIASRPHVLKHKLNF